MKRLLILMMLVSLPAWAEWVELGRKGKGQAAFTQYIDPTTVRKSTNGRRAWVMWNFDQTQREASPWYRSVIFLDEFDCAGERSRTLQWSEYSGPMGVGEVVFTSEGNGRWVISPPDSIGMGAIEHACAIPLGMGPKPDNSQEIKGLKLAVTQENGAEVFVDFSKIDKSQYPLRMFRGVVNYVNGGSDVIKLVADCSNGSLATLHRVAFTESFAKGNSKILKNEKDGKVKFESIKVNSAIGNLVSMVCK